MMKASPVFSTLVVFALRQESAGLFDDVPVLYTGVGKVQATYALSDAIARKRPERVINFGSAGSQIFPARSLVTATQFMQRDMDVTALGFGMYETPYSDLPIILHHGAVVPGYPHAVCGSGDSFVTTKTGQEPWQIVDMEAYALSYVCAQEEIPFYCLKYVTDGADGKAPLEWKEALREGAQAMRAVYDRMMLRPLSDTFTKPA